MRTLLMLLISLFSASVMAESPPFIPLPPQPMAKAILAGGCFWCLEHDMLKLEGVTNAVSGYTGGTIPNATYENYHDEIPGQKPHVEAVEVTYNPAVLSYGALLDYFLRHIDPTDGGGQFCDRGAAYRPVIFTAHAAEAELAADKLAEAGKALKQRINVEVLPVSTFWPAEEYHQRYAEKNPIRYKGYRWSCGRDKRVKDVWRD